MNERDRIKQELDCGRKKMHDLGLRTNFAFDDPEMLRLSEAMDALVIQYERCRAKQDGKK